MGELLEKMVVVVTCSLDSQMVIAKYLLETLRVLLVKVFEMIDDDVAERISNGDGNLVAHKVVPRGRWLEVGRVDYSIHKACPMRKYVRNVLTQEHAILED